MLGEKVGEFTGRVTGQRVLAEDEHQHRHDHGHGHGPRLEVTITQAGSVVGIAGTDIGTYESALQPGGFFKGRGQGITTTKDGENVTWTAEGVGRPTGKGMATAWRGLITYQTRSQKLARLNGVCCIFEHDIDEKGEGSTTRVFEWR